MLDCSMRERGTPLNETSPSTVIDGGLRPPRIEMRDVFPDPEGPISPKTSLGCTTPLQLYSTCTQVSLVMMCCVCSRNSHLPVAAATDGKLAAPTLCSMDAEMLFHISSIACGRVNTIWPLVVTCAAWALQGWMSETICRRSYHEKNP